MAEERRMRLSTDGGCALCFGLLVAAERTPTTQAEIDQIVGGVRAVKEAFEQ